LTFRYRYFFGVIIFAAMNKLAAVSTDMNVIHRVIVESLQVSGYRIEASELTIKSAVESYEVQITIRVERPW